MFVSASDLRQVWPSPVPIPLFRSLHSFGLSLRPSSRQPQFDPAIFSVWCPIIRPSLHSPGPLTPFLSLSCVLCSAVLQIPPLLAALLFCPSFPSSVFLFASCCLLSMLCCLSLNLLSSLLSFCVPLSLSHFFFLAICLKIAVSWAGGASNSGA